MSLWIRLVALVLYITAACRHVKSRQRPLLPFLCDRQNLIRNAAYRRIRDIYAVNILDMCFDIAGCHALGIHRQNLLLDILTDTGLILFQQLRLKFTLAIPRNCYFYIAETGAKCLTAVAIAAVFGVFCCDNRTCCTPIPHPVQFPDRLP